VQPFLLVDNVDPCIFLFLIGRKRYFSSPVCRERAIYRIPQVHSLYLCSRQRYSPYIVPFRFAHLQLSSKLQCRRRSIPTCASAAVVNASLEHWLCSDTLCNHTCTALMFAMAKDVGFCLCVFLRFAGHLLGFNSVFRFAKYPGRFLVHMFHASQCYISEHLHYWCGLRLKV
jgi:hypothetical protein